MLVLDKTIVTFAGALVNMTVAVVAAVHNVAVVGTVVVIVVVAIVVVVNGLYI